MRLATVCVVALCLGCDKPVAVVEELPPPETGGQVRPQSMNVTINLGGFVPASGVLRAGGTVSWFLYYQYPGTYSHRIVADDGSFSSPQLQTGKGAPSSDTQTWSRVFTDAGTFRYHCANHPGERGTVTVS